jgi:hypothetical protein
MGNPQQLRPSIVILSDAETERVRRFIKKAGTIRGATVRLKLGDATIEAARDYGRMMRSTRVRLLEALDREEAAP